MAAPTLDFRPAGLFFRWPPAGATTVALRAPVGTLEGRELRMWVQPKALSVPDLEQATAVATVGAVTTEEVDGDDFDVAVATFADVALLTQGTWYRVLLADGDQVWANGLVRTSNDGTAEQSTTLNVAVASGSIELQITVAPAGPSGGTGLPTGTAGQMFRIAEDGTTVEAVTPNTASAPVRLDGDATIPDILLPSSIARDSEVAAAVGDVTPVFVGSALACSAVDGTATSFEVVQAQRGAAASGVVPAGWVSVYSVPDVATLEALFAFQGITTATLLVPSEPGVYQVAADALDEPWTDITPADGVKVSVTTGGFEWCWF